MCLLSQSSEVRRGTGEESLFCAVIQGPMILPTSGLAIVLKDVSQIQNHLEGLLIPRLLGPNSRVADLGRSWVGPKNLHFEQVSRWYTCYCSWDPIFRTTAG